MQILLCMSFMAIAQLGHAELDTPVPSDIGNNNKGDDNLINSVNQFGFKLLTKLMKQYPDENIVISPASISCFLNVFTGNAIGFLQTTMVAIVYCAVTYKNTYSSLLAMALLGCVGRSYDELAKALGFSEDILINRQNHELFGELLKQVNSNDSWSKTMLADVVFVDHRTQLREAYRAYLDKVYNGEILNVDFTDEVRVKEFINKWVSEQTNGKIDNFLKESLPINTKVVLLSALYFSGQWEKPFIPEYTKQLPFTNGKKNIVADLMLNLGQFKYVFAVKDGLHMIALPYNDSLNTMYVLKPRRPENLTLPTLMENLDVTKIDTIINQMTKQDVVIRFPKMEIKKDLNLQTALKELGVRSIFDPRESNFALMIDTNIARNITEDELLSNINGSQAEEKSLNNLLNSLMNPGVYVDSVMHEVKIKINEYGTEAVAATSGTLARSSEVFYADTPFFMFIRNEKTKMITFSAVVYNPSV